MTTIPTYDQELLARRSMTERIREYARDYDVLNTLIEGEEHSDRMIIHAMERVVDDFNASPPAIGAYLVVNFPSLEVLISGTMAILLESVAILYARNDLAYAHAGTQVQFNQHRDYLQMSQMLWQRYEVKKKEIKVAFNAEMAVSNSGSFFSTFVTVYRPAWRVYNLVDYARPYNY